MSTPSPSSFSQRPKQQGTSLLEGLISMLLIATLGLSLMVVISNTLNTQRYLITENWAFMNLRNLLMTDESSMERKNSQGETVTISVTKVDVEREIQVTVDGISKTISVTSSQLQINDTEHVSGDGTLILSP
ncbi:MAG: hypothetical protein M0Q95_14350 [Porticoccaceae bacterium]|nr:hypothetical protein [Porticoccaceae bacterium]